MYGSFGRSFVRRCAVKCDTPEKLATTAARNKDMANAHTIDTHTDTQRARSLRCCSRAFMSSGIFFSSIFTFRLYRIAKYFVVFASLSHASHSSCTTSDCRPFISVWTFLRREPFCRWKTNGMRWKPWINFGEPNWAVFSLRPNRCFNPTITISHFREFDLVFIFFFIFVFSDGGRKTETISNERWWTTAEFRGNDSKSEYKQIKRNIFWFR